MIRDCDAAFLSCKIISEFRGVSRIFERGGSNISWFPKKRSSDFKRGGSNGLMGGSSKFVSL